MSLTGAELWREYKEEPTLALRNRLIERYLPLVRFQAARLLKRLPADNEFGDLVAAGVFGLLDAIEAYDLARKVKFETFSILRIRGAMLDHLRDLDWVPRKTRANGVPLAALISLSGVRHHAGPTFVDRRAERPGRHVEACDLCDLVKRQLPARDWLILVAYHCAGLTMRQVGAVFSLTESRISQKLAQIHHRLRTNPRLCREVG